MDWTTSPDYSRQWALLPEQPAWPLRVVAVIQNDEDAQAPDGDAYEPALVGGGWAVRDYDACGSVFEDPDVLEAFLLACNHFGVLPSAANYEDDGIVARYMRIFWDTVFAATGSSSDQYSNVIVFSTPAYREHVGQSSSVKTASVEPGDWQHYLNGDVFGIGWAIVPADHDLDLYGLDGLDVQMQVWGFYGEEYARASAVGENVEPKSSDFQDYLRPSIELLVDLARKRVSTTMDHRSKRYAEGVLDTLTWLGGGKRAGELVWIYRGVDDPYLLDIRPYQ
jgi:hypothetical protein